MENLGQPVVFYNGAALSNSELREIGQSLGTKERTIQILSFRNSQIGDSGILAFQKGLMEASIINSQEEIKEEIDGHTIDQRLLPDLLELDLSNTGLGIRGLRVLLRLESECPKLSKLNLSGNAFEWDNTCNRFHSQDETSLEALEAWPPGPPHYPWFRTIQDLDMSSCSINTNLARVFFIQLTTSRFGYQYDGETEIPLRVLQLSNNPICDLGLESLQWILPSLERLHLSNCTLSDKALDWMIDFLDPDEFGNQMNFCRTIDLSNNNITSAGASSLSHCFKFVTTMEDVDVYPKFDKPSFQNVTHLDLSGNPLGANGVGYILESLKFRSWGSWGHPSTNVNFEVEPATLSTLDLSRTGCGKEGVKLALEHAQGIGLKHLYLASNNVGPNADLDRWLEKSQAIRVLQSLDLSDNHLSWETILDALNGLDADLAYLEDYALQCIIFGRITNNDINDDQRTQINDMIQEFKNKYGVEIVCD